MLRHILISMLLALSSPVWAEAKLIHPPYGSPKVVYDIFLDDPAKMGAALYWIRSLVLPLSEPPYSHDPETIKVVIHGTELVTVAKKNEGQYQEVVDRMRYYAQMGVEFKVCGLAMADYGYALKDLQDFVQVVPSAMAELVYWQNQGYALLIPQILDKKHDTEKIR